MGRFNLNQKLGFLIAFVILMRVIVGGAGLSGAKRIEGALPVVSEERLPTANTLSTVRNSMATLHVACLEASLWRFVQYRQFARRIRLEFASFRGRRYPGNIVSAAPLPIHCFT